MPDHAYVFGYASLVALREPAALPGRLRGFRRFWGAAMDNWDPANDPKHFLDRAGGERPRIRVAYLDVGPSEGDSVNGLAIPVDAERLAALDAREVNYERIAVSEAFEPGAHIEGADLPAPSPPSRVFTYVGADAARERCRRGLADGDCFVSSEYLAAVRAAFTALGDHALVEFDRTTDPLPFPERDLIPILDGRAVA